MLVPKKTVDPQIITFCHYLLKHLNTIPSF